MNSKLLPKWDGMSVLNTSINEDTPVNAVSQAAMNEQLVSRIIRLANHAESLPEMLALILNHAMKSFSFEGGAIYIFGIDQNKAILSCRHNYPDFFAEISDQLCTDNDFHRHLIDEQQILVARHQRPFASSELYFSPFITSITLPMFYKSRPVGLIQFLSDGKNTFVESEVQALRSLAEESGIMVNRSKKLERALENEQSCYSLLNAVSDMVFTMDYQGNILNANMAAFQTLGMTRDNLTRQKLQDLFQPEHQARAHKVIEDYILKGQAQNQFPIHNTRGDLISVESTMAKFSSRNREMLFALCRELPGKQVKEDEASLKEELYRHIFEQATDGIILYEETGRIVAYNRTTLDMLGYSEEEVKNRSVFDFVIPEDRDGIKAKLVARGLHDEPVRSEVSVIAKDGSRIEMEISTSRFNGIQDLKLIQAIARDITERKKKEEKLKYVSMHDSLTGLYNRNYFEEEVIRMESGSIDPIGIIICDVDGLKLTNDYFGHQAGDELLRHTAGIIRECFRDCDISSRIGGDEFCILLPGADWKGVLASLKRLENAVEAYNQAMPRVFISLSKGCAVRHSDSGSMKEALNKADESMYENKVGNYARFTSQFNQFIGKMDGKGS